MASAFYRVLCAVRDDAFRLSIDAFRIADDILAYAGDRPISRVPSSCFAMANLSPFQRGYGSLQLFSVHQQVPNGVGSDFDLTALRQDAIMAKAPGVFKEAPIDINGTVSIVRNGSSGGRRLPERTPELVSSIQTNGSWFDCRLTHVLSVVSSYC